MNEETPSSYRHDQDREIAKLHAEVLDLRRLLGHYSTVEIALKKQESMVCQLREIRALVDKQAEDEGLWYINGNASTAYLQQEFRKLHDLIEKQSTSKGGI